MRGCILSAVGRSSGPGQRRNLVLEPEEAAFDNLSLNFSATAASLTDNSRADKAVAEEPTLDHLSYSRSATLTHSAHYHRRHDS